VDFSWASALAESRSAASDLFDARDARFLRMALLITFGPRA
jgi:hypothetical protein